MDQMFSFDDNLSQCPLEPQLELCSKSITILCSPIEEDDRIALRVFGLEKRSIILRILFRSNAPIVKRKTVKNEEIIAAPRADSKDRTREISSNSLTKSSSLAIH